MLKVTVLGCGSSGGVPLMGCTCPVCLSDNPRNNRTRASILVEMECTAILIDTSPDMRTQCLRENISKVDAIIYTHAHADHLHGIDDVRTFNYTKNSAIDTYSDAATLEKMKQRFDYVFLPPQPISGPMEGGWYRPCLNPITVTPLTPFNIEGIEVLPLPQKHGRGDSLGLRVGNFAYSTDTNFMPEETLSALEGIDTWIVDCLRYDVAPTHAHLEMTLGWIARIKPKRAYLTHLNHQMDYGTLLRELPEGVEPAYDGLNPSSKAMKVSNSCLNSGTAAIFPL
jgi:phosphoribosyl 1,2-cyclic phosphate phosphodiesterase